MMFWETMRFEETLPTIRSGLKALAKEFLFEFEVVDMDEMVKGFESGDNSIKTLMSELEQTHYNSIKLEKNRIQWIAGRYAVKSALLKYKLKGSSIIDLKNIDVLKGQDSAPYILQYPEINCTISHSAAICIGMVSDRIIGVDIEKIYTPEDSLIRYFYTNEEKEVLLNCKDTNEYSNQSMIFWTRKEAVSKFLKLGMKMNFKELDTTRDRISVGNSYINVISLTDNNFCLSLACKG